MTSSELQRSSMPKGTVTFLVCGGEATMARQDEALVSGADAVVGALDVLDDAISRHGGMRPAGDGDGDGVVGVFSRPSDAFAAALEAQLEFGARERSVGTVCAVPMAVHTGEAHLHDEGSYFGDALDRCGRISRSATPARC